MAAPISPRLVIVVGVRACLLFLALCLLGDSTRAMLCAVHDDAPLAMSQMGGPTVHAPQPGDDCQFCAGCTDCSGCCVLAPGVPAASMAITARAFHGATSRRTLLASAAPQRLPDEFLRPPTAV